MKSWRLLGSLLAALMVGCGVEDTGTPSEVYVAISGPDTAYMFFPAAYEASVQSDAPVYSVAWNFDHDDEVDTLGAGLEQVEASFPSYYNMQETSVDGQYATWCQARARVVTKDRGVAYGYLDLPCVNTPELYRYLAQSPQMDAQGRLLWTPALIWPNAPQAIRSQLRMGFFYRAATLANFSPGSDVELGTIKPDTVLAWGDTLRIAPFADSLALMVRVENWYKEQGGDDWWYYQRLRVKATSSEEQWFATRISNNASWLMHPVRAALADRATACPVGYHSASLDEMLSLYEGFIPTTLTEWVKLGRLSRNDHFYLDLDTTTNERCTTVDELIDNLKSKSNYSAMAQSCSDPVWLFCTAPILSYQMWL